MRFGQRNQSRFFILLSIALYIACMPLESFCISINCGTWPGWGVLLFGSLGVFSLTPANLTWFANPLLFCAWVFALTSTRIPAVILATFALAIGASFLAFKTVVTNEAGLEMPITGYAAGYWLWLASMACASLGAIYVVPRRAPQQG